MSRQCLSNWVIVNQPTNDCLLDGHPDTSGIEAKGERSFINNNDYSSKQTKQNSPCKQLRWFYIKHHYSAHSGKHEQQTYPVPCEQWRRSFSHSFRFPKSSSNVREPQRLFGHRPGFLTMEEINGFAQHKLSIFFSSPHLAELQSSTAKWKHSQTSNCPALLRR